MPSVAARAESGWFRAPRVAAVALAMSAPWVVPAMRDASWAALGRDQGIFQYVAWAAGEGDRLYRDVRDVNGPVVPLIHALFQALGGADEHRFRVLDLAVTSLSFAFAGACLPRIVALRGRVDGPLWALGGFAVLMAQYLAYGFWDTAQRESFFDWFVLAAVALQAASNHPRAIAVSGALSCVPWLGKPTYVLFTLVQAITILLGNDRWQRTVRFVLGGLAGLALPSVYLLARGDVRAWARITFIDVPTMYRFIWPRPASAILSLPGYTSTAAIAIAVSTVLVFSIVIRALPIRALPVALFPLIGLVSVIVQAKGFPYHFHPVTLGSTYGALLAVACIAGRPRAIAWIGAALAAALSVRASIHARSAPYAPAPEETKREEHIALHERVDFFPIALREAAAYLDAHTAPDERVQTYGMDPYVLFMARRRSATPYIYAYDLDADAALYGSFDPGGLRPDTEQRRRIAELRDAHARDLLERLERAPPAAFVFIDRSPLLVDADAWLDFRSHCPAAAAWVERHYRPAVRFDAFQVWMREKG
jgi:hypothetical protein